MKQLKLGAEKFDLTSYAGHLAEVTLKLTWGLNMYTSIVHR